MTFDLAPPASQERNAGGTDRSWMRWPYWQGLLGVGLGELPLSHPGNSRFAYSPGPTWGLGGSVKWLMTYGTEPGAFAILKGKLSSVPSELICAPRVVPVSPGRPPARSKCGRPSTVACPTPTGPDTSRPAAAVVVQSWPHSSLLGRRYQQLPRRSFRSRSHSRSTGPPG